MALSLFLAGILRAQDPQDPPPATPVPAPQAQDDELDIENLMNVQVTSPSKKEQPLADVAAAIHVIRGEDIRRLGVTSLPEALRGVPGMQVARTRSSTWAVSARGFNDNLSNKLLVLIDGRSVYSPLHSGVFWDTQDTFLEDVDRIEVIRGPGGSLWGANAINGVVNVITKRAEDTQGLVVSGGGGTEERAFGGVRYGFKVDDDHSMRVYAKYAARDNARDGVDPDEDARDGWFMGRGGFRSDWKAGDQDRLTFTGDFYRGEEKERVIAPSLTAPAGFTVEDTRLKAHGGHFLFRWERTIDETSSLAIQLYYDYSSRSQEIFDDVFHTGDFDLQHGFRPFDGHDILWGVGYRIYRSDFDGSFPFQLDPEERTDDVVSAFLQDEIKLIENRLRLTVGSKFEYNDYSGFEAQPSARLAWTFADRQMFWASASRAVRTPSIIDESGRLSPIVIPGPVPLVFSIFGDPDFRTEELIAYEAGYRLGLANTFSADLAVFYNRYDRLRSGAPAPAFPEFDPAPLHFVIPVNLENELDGKCRGAEAAVNVQLGPEVLIQASYAYLRMDMSSETAEGRDPQHTAWVRAAVDLGPGWTVDAMGRYVSRLKAFDVDKYIEADLRIAWRDPSRRMEVSIVGQNLLRESHEEFQVEAQRSEIERGVYLSLRWEL